MHFCESRSVQDGKGQARMLSQAVLAWSAKDVFVLENGHTFNDKRKIASFYFSTFPVICGSSPVGNLRLFGLCFLEHLETDVLKMPMQLLQLNSYCFLLYPVLPYGYVSFVFFSVCGSHFHQVRSFNADLYRELAEVVKPEAVLLTFFDLLRNIYIYMYIIIYL